MTTPIDDDYDDEFTELTSARFGRVDLVQSPAHGQPGFLVMKQDDSAGLMDPGFVRELIAKGEPEPPAPAARDDVTMTGSPGAIAAFIHKASEKAPATAMADAFARGLSASTGSVATHLQLDGAEIARSVQGAAVAKAEQSAKTQNGLPDSDFAYIEPGGSKDADGKTTPRSLRHFNIDVAKEAGVASSTITKDSTGPDMDKGIDGLDPTVPLAAPDVMAPGDPMVPGSPAWESIDAATACKWMSIAARLKNALCTMAERELIEAAVADPSDASGAWDLQDAMCAVDYVIDTLACFAAGEKAEVDLAADTMAMIGKALSSFDTAPLEAIEGIAPIAKSGRVLSASNESAIRDAHDSLQKVLMSLPQAPAAADDVQKEAAVAADQTSTEASPEAVAKAGTPATTVTITAGDPAGSAGGGGGASSAQPAPQTAPPVAAPSAAPIAKADGDDMPTDAPCMVYDATGKPMGIVDMASITAIQGAAPAVGTMAMDDAKAGEGMPMDAEKPADPAAPADAAVDPSAPADPCDMTPQPAADAGTSTEDAKVAKAGAATQTITIGNDQLESIIAKAVTAALDAAGTAEGISKSDAADAAAVVKSLEDRLAVVEGQPAMPKVFTNGAVPPPDAMRGQGDAPAGSAPLGDPSNIAKAAELKGTLYHGTGPQQAQAAQQMQGMADAQLAAIHARGPA